jgi:hypothetical protein
VRRRAFAGVQMSFLFFVLLPVFSPPRTTLAAFVFAAPFLIGFLIDWLAVSSLRVSRLVGRMNSGFRHVKAAIDWLPTVLRAAAALLLTARVITGMHGALALAETVVAVFLLLGLSGRISAILGLVLLGIQPLAAELASIQILLIVLYTAVLYLGTGPLSLWRPEERWIYRRAGERMG